jgi:hypothetical protein
MKSLPWGFALSTLLAVHVLLLPAGLMAQSITTSIGWHHNDFDNRVTSLGQSTSALFNPSSHSLNPAVPLPEEGVLYLNSPLHTTDIYALEDPNFDGISLFNPSAAYAVSGFTFRLMVDRSFYTSQLLTHSQAFHLDFVNTMAKFHAGYAISETISAGVGFTYSTFTLDSEMDVSGQPEVEANAWGLSLGLFYRDKFWLDSFNVAPQVGLSFNDLSTGFSSENSNENEPMPGQIRLAFGLDTRTEAIWLDRPALSLGIYTGFSKYLARSDYDSESGEVTVPSGFESVFTGWKPVSRFDGMGTTKISVGEQISASIGVEAGLAETLYFRFGRFGGAELWAPSHSSAGVGLDLYYLSLGVSHVWYQDTEQFISPLENETNFSITARIPLDGQPRNTVIGRLLGR